MKLFDPDSRLMQFLSRVADLLVLNLLWLICCVPVVTAGASTTAMYHVLRHWQDGEGPSVARDFFRSFRDDFRQATPVFLILLLPTVSLVLSFPAIFQGGAEVPFYLRVMWMISALLVTFAVSYVYPLMSHFDDTLLHTIRNALILSFAKLPRTLLVCALNLLPLAVLLLNPAFFVNSLIFWLLIGGALIAALNAAILRPVFRKMLSPASAPEEDAD